MKKAALSEVKANLSRFLARVQAARDSIRAGRGVRRDDLPHLLRSPANARRLHRALARSRKGGGRLCSPRTLARS